MAYTLTPSQRAYFRRLDRSILLIDVVRDLTQDFGLTPEQAGQAIIAAVMEDLPTTPVRRPSPESHPDA